MTGRVNGIIASYYFHALALALILATILMMSFGYKATSEWRRSTRQIVDQRTSEVMTLMITALSRDMRGAQSQVLPQLDPVAADSPWPYDLADDISKAFARFPYPESFFTWTDDKAGKVFYVFNRDDRPPPWYNGRKEGIPFPTVILKDPPELAGLVPFLQRSASLHTRFVLFETQIAGETYQVIGHPVYDGARNAQLRGIVGFTVNIQWAREHYFSELISQISRIVDGQSSMALQILDESGALITTNRSGTTIKAGSDVPMREQGFPLFFFDPVLRAASPDETLPVRLWTARAQPLEEPSTLAAASGASRTFALISLAAVIAVIALLLTVRAGRAAATLATMKSEFVSTVTHELKTPLSSIRMVSETLAQGRFRTSEKISEYASVLLNDVSRLTRTVDNLLTFSRVADVERFYTFEALDPGAVLEEALNRFHPQLQQQGFEVAIDIPPTLPSVKADRTAILQVLENLLDNAIRYSNGTRYVGVSASATRDEIQLQVTDKGRGIPSDEIPRVFEKFFRGRDVFPAGSGLGLAIAQRIVKDHRGEIRLQSSVGMGTTAQIVLPVAEEEAVT